MEGMKGFETGSSSASSSSFTSELFGSTEPPSSSAGIFGSIFAPPSKVLGRGSLRSDLITKRQNCPNEPCNTKPEASGNFSKKFDGGDQSIANKEASSIYQDQRVHPCHPCHLSSSIYYGGQDVFCHPQSGQDSGLNSLYNKDFDEDDSGKATRGNWWQGSLYY